MEKLEEVQMTVKSVMPGPNKNESRQKLKLFKSKKESMMSVAVQAELEAKRE